MTTAKPDDVPSDPAALQVHLSLDEPSGTRAALLRDYYCDAPTDVRDPHACIDMCNEYLEFTVKGCWVCGAEASSGSGERTCAEHAACEETR